MGPTGVVPIVFVQVVIHSLMFSADLRTSPSPHIGNVDGLPPSLLSAAPNASIAIFEPLGQDTFTRFSKAIFSALGYL